MLKLFEEILLKFLERELIHYEPEVQAFMIKELQAFVQILTKYIEDKMPHLIAKK